MASSRHGSFEPPACWFHSCKAPFKGEAVWNLVPNTKPSSSGMLGAVAERQHSATAALHNVN
eukprot:1074291-Rhodomonas_salina.1